MTFVRSDSRVNSLVDAQRGFARKILSAYFTPECFGGFVRLQVGRKHYGQAKTLLAYVTGERSILGVGQHVTVLFVLDKLSTDFADDITGRTGPGWTTPPFGVMEFLQLFQVLLEHKYLLHHDD